MNSKNIAVSAITASIIAVFLILGSYVTVLDLASVILASAFVVTPLYKKSYLGAFLAYLVGGVIAFISYGFNPITLVFPAFFSFFGVYPIVQSKLNEKGVKKWVIFLIGSVWCSAVCYGLYFYYTLFMNFPLENLPAWFVNNIYLLFLPIALIVYFVFDRFIFISKKAMYYYLSKIIK